MYTYISYVPFRRGIIYVCTVHSKYIRTYTVKVYQFICIMHVFSLFSKFATQQGTKGVVAVADDKLLVNNVIFSCTLLPTWKHQSATKYITYVDDKECLP